MSAEMKALRSFEARAMALVWERLYPGASESVFARERRDLLRAASEPAAYLHARSLTGTSAMYLGVLEAVIGQLLEKGTSWRESCNKPLLLRTWMQQYLRLEGDLLIEQAKRLRDQAVPRLFRAELRRQRVVPDAEAAAFVTEALVAARRLLAEPTRVPKPRFSR